MARYLFSPHSVSAVGAAAALIMVTPAAAAGPVTLAPHRAVYELKLLRATGSRPIEALRGRILYDFSGSPCEGYGLQFRQVSEIDSGEGRTSLSDLRAITWEDGMAKTFRFNSQNYLNQKMVDSVDGWAERNADAVAVRLTKPQEKSFNLSADMVFPAQHMRRIVEAAIDGRPLLEFPVYDGSENGAKVFDTLTVIGQPIAPEKKPADASAAHVALTSLKRWPVTISYFERGAARGGEQTPVYSIGFELFENGISRALNLDYGEFVVAGDMSQLELKEAKPCP